MSDTPMASDTDLMKLLDNGWEIRLFANTLGSYTAHAKSMRSKKVITTDDFTPLQALHRLAEKVTTGRIV